MNPNTAQIRVLAALNDAPGAMHVPRILRDPILEGLTTQTILRALSDLHDARRVRLTSSGYRDVTR